MSESKMSQEQLLVVIGTSALFRPDSAGPSRIIGYGKILSMAELALTGSNGLSMVVKAS
jgi:hypothetical protein